MLGVWLFDGTFSAIGIRILFKLCMSLLSPGTLYIGPRTYFYFCGNALTCSVVF